MPSARRTMVNMDPFQELGITAVAEEPQPRTRARNVSEFLTTIVAGTAVTAGVIFALVVVIVIAAGADLYFQLQH
jgi:hypothetical protein